MSHRSKECTAAPRCSLCADANRRSNHRFGGKSCIDRISKKREGRVSTQEDKNTMATSPEAAITLSIVSNRNPMDEGILAAKVDGAEGLNVPVKDGSFTNKY